MSASTVARPVIRHRVAAGPGSGHRHANVRQLWLEFWIQYVAEEVPHRAYLRIEEQRSRANLRERTAYWYGLIDKRDPAVDYYEGLHFHAEPPRHPTPVPHRKVVVKGVLRDWQLEPGLVSVADAVLRLLRVYWARTEGANE